MSDAPILTIAIPPYPRDHIIFQTIENVRRYMDDRMELIIADQNESHEASVRERLSGLQSEGVIRWIETHQQSLPQARNIVLLGSRAPIVLFLDDDVIIPDGFLQAHLRAHEDKLAAAVTGQVYNCRPGSAVPDISNPGEGTDKLFSLPGRQYGVSVSGCNHSVKRGPLMDIGGYDTRFIGAALGEDLDMARRLLMAGHEILYEPDAWLLHLRTPMGGSRIDSGTAWKEWSNSACLFLQAFRHGLRRGNFRQLLWAAMRNGPLRRQIVMRPWRWPGAFLSALYGLCYGFCFRNDVRGLKNIRLTKDVIT